MLLAQLHTGSFSALQVLTCEMRRKLQLAVPILDPQSLVKYALGYNQTVFCFSDWLGHSLGT